MLSKSQYSAMLAFAACKIAARLCADYRGKAPSWCDFFLRFTLIAGLVDHDVHGIFTDCLARLVDKACADAVWPATK